MDILTPQCLINTTMLSYTLMGLGAQARTRGLGAHWQQAQLELELEDRTFAARLGLNGHTRPLAHGAVLCFFLFFGKQFH
jgi:hypothetical protein